MKQIFSCADHDSYSMDKEMSVIFLIRNSFILTVNMN